MGGHPENRNFRAKVTRRRAKKLGLNSLAVGDRALEKTKESTGIGRWLTAEWECRTANVPRRGAKRRD